MTRKGNKWMCSTSSIVFDCLFGENKVNTSTKLDKASFDWKSVQYLESIKSMTLGVQVINMVSEKMVLNKIYISDNYTIWYANNPNIAHQNMIVELLQLCNIITDKFTCSMELRLFSRFLNTSQDICKKSIAHGYTGLKLVTNANGSTNHTTIRAKKSIWAKIWEILKTFIQFNSQSRMETVKFKLLIHKPKYIISMMIHREKKTCGRN